MIWEVLEPPSKTLGFSALFGNPKKDAKRSWTPVFCPINMANLGIYTVYIYIQIQFSDAYHIIKLVI